MTTKQFLKKNEKILNFASMDAYCGFPAGTFSAVMRGKIKFSLEREVIVHSLAGRLGDSCCKLIEGDDMPTVNPKKKKGHRK